MARGAGRVYLHVGVPKTGTTFLQGVSLGQPQDSERARRPVPRSRVRPLLGGAGPHRAPLHGTGEPQGPRRMGQAGSPGTTLAGQRGAVPRAVHPRHRARTCDGRSADLEPAELHVVLTVRDFERQLPAVWQERLKNGGRVSFARHFAQTLEKDATRSSEPSGLLAPAGRRPDPVAVGRGRPSRPHPRDHHPAAGGAAGHAVATVRRGRRVRRRPHRPRDRPVERERLPEAPAGPTAATHQHRAAGCAHPRRLPLGGQALPVRVGHRSGRLLDGLRLQHRAARHRPPLVRRAAGAGGDRRVRRRGQSLRADRLRRPGRRAARSRRRPRRRRGPGSGRSSSGTGAMDGRSAGDSGPEAAAGARRPRCGPAAKVAGCRPRVPSSCTSVCPRPVPRTCSGSSTRTVRHCGRRGCCTPAAVPTTSCRHRTCSSGPFVATGRAGHRHLAGDRARGRRLAGPRPRSPTRRSRWRAPSRCRRSWPPSPTVPWRSSSPPVISLDS